MLHHNKIVKESALNSKDAPRKRVARACDRCRLKKGKCDGKEQCAKCVSADVMCIYTDRKPPQHKLISPAVAEALQSENLTLKKAAIIIFKQLMEARDGDLPAIDGVDWSSEKVANGKSGRALNYIISQQAKVDNRISNEEITNYDSDTQMLDSSSSRTCPDSPSSRQSSPHSTAGDPVGAYWGNNFEAIQPEQVPVRESKRKSANEKYGGYSAVPETSITGISNMQVPSPSTGTFIDPNLLQPAGPICSPPNHPPTPPTTLDSLDFLPSGSMPWPGQQQSQSRFYDERYVLQQRFFPEENARGACGDPTTWVAPMEFYHLFAEKELGKGFQTMPGGEAQMYSRDM